LHPRPLGGSSNYYTYLARWNVALSVTLTAIVPHLVAVSYCHFSELRIEPR
jgi:predicted Na+-dependent transporter